VGDQISAFRLFPMAAGLIGALAETLAKAMTLALNAADLGAAAAVVVVTAMFIASELYVIRASLRVLPMYLHQPIFYATWGVGGMLSGAYVYGDAQIYKDDYAAASVTVIGIGLVLFGCILPAAFNSNQPRPPLAIGQISSVLGCCILNKDSEFEMHRLATRSL
jgi:hypothetical protein